MYLYSYDNIDEICCKYGYPDGELFAMDPDFEEFIFEEKPAELIEKRHSEMIFKIDGIEYSFVETKCLGMIEFICSDLPGRIHEV